jgi:hypothetical protein
LFDGHGIIWIWICSGQSYCHLRYVSHSYGHPTLKKLQNCTMTSSWICWIAYYPLGRWFVAPGHLTLGSTLIVDSPSVTLVASSGLPRLLVAAPKLTLPVHLLLPPTPPGPSGLLSDVLIAIFDTGSAHPSGLMSSLPPSTRDRSGRLLTACLVVGDVPATPSVRTCCRTTSAPKWIVFVSRLPARLLRHLLRLRMVSACLLSVMSRWLTSLPPSSTYLTSRLQPIHFPLVFSAVLLIYFYHFLPIFLIFHSTAVPFLLALRMPFSRPFLRRRGSQPLTLLSAYFQLVCYF